MSADFTPEKEDYKILTPFKMQVLTNFPYIEADFDALTNYQLLCKVVEYLNNVITNENEVTEQVNSLYNAYVSLQAYVNNYFDNLNLQTEVNIKLDKMAEDGTLTNLIKGYIDPIFETYTNALDADITAYKTSVNNSINTFESTVNTQVTQIDAKVDAAVSGSPLVATSTADMTETDRVYVNTTDGNWYYYDGDSWEIGGIYQSSGIADNSIIDPYIAYGTISPDKLVNVPIEPIYEVFKNSYLYSGKKYNDTTGVLETDAEYNCYELTPVEPGQSVRNYSQNASYYRIVEFDSSKRFIQSEPISASYTVQLTANTHYIAFNYKPGVNSLINIVNLDTNADKFNIPWLVNNEKNYALNSISPFNIKDVEEYALDDVFKFTTWEKDRRLYDGYMIAYSGYSTTDFAVINNATSLQFNTSYTSPARYAIYDSNKDLVYEVAGIPADLTLTNEHTGKYIRVCIPTASIPTFKCTNLDGLSKINIPWLDNNKEVNGIVYGDSLWSNCRGNFNYTTTPYHTSTDKCYGYVQYLNDNNIKIYNRARSGTSIADCWNNTADDVCIQHMTAEILANYDFVIFSFGRNDSAGSLPLGTLGQQGDPYANFNTNTFYGAYRKCIEYLLSLKPELRIILWTPTQTDANGYGPNDTNNVGLKQVDYVNAIKNIAELYSANVVDMYNNSGLNITTLPSWTFEGVHLTNDGYRFTSSYYVNKMKEYLE